MRFSRAFIVIVVMLLGIAAQMGSFFLAVHDEPFEEFPAGTERAIGFPMGYVYSSVHYCCEGFMTDERSYFDPWHLAIDIAFFVALAAVLALFSENKSVQAPFLERKER